MKIKTHSNTFFTYIKLPFNVSPLISFIIVIHNLVNALLPSLSVLVLSKFVNTVIFIINGVENTSTVYPLLVMYALTIVYSWVMGIAINFAHMKLNMKMELFLKEKVISKRASVKYQYVEDDEIWDLISRIGGDAPYKIAEGFSNVLGMVSFLVEIISVVSILVSIIWWSPIPTLIFAIPIYILSKKYGERDYLIRTESQKYKRRANAYGELLSSRYNVEERTVFAYTAPLNNRWHDLYEQSRLISKKATINHYKKRTFLHILSILGTLTVSSVILIPLSKNIITIGDFMAIVTAVYTLEQLVSWRLSRIAYNFANSRRYLEDYNRLMNLDEVDDVLCEPKVFYGKLDKIEFKNVTFKYPNSPKPILHNLSMTLYGNKHYAFVGKNGAGKTTITKLLTGMYSDYDGEILIDGIELRKYTAAQLKGIFSVVYQDFAKYEISIRESLLLGNSANCDETTIHAILDTVDLQNEIERFEKGIDTPLGKTRVDGTDISGGQWQRIAVARNMLSICPVRILDEPTASLDPISERSIYNAFNKINRGQMTIFITHRLGAVLLADEIIVFEDGKIVERGSHDELISSQGIYEEMYNSQKSWYEEEK